MPTAWAGARACWSRAQTSCFAYRPVGLGLGPVGLELGPRDPHANLQVYKLEPSCQAVGLELQTCPSRPRTLRNACQPEGRTLGPVGVKVGPQDSHTDLSAWSSDLSVQCSDIVILMPTGQSKAPTLGLETGARDSHTNMSVSCSVLSV